MDIRLSAERSAMMEVMLEQPEQVAQAFVEAWEDRDPDAIAALFVADADFVNVTGLWWHDQPSIRRAHARGFRVMFGKSTMRLVETRVRDLGEVAVVHAHWAMTGQTTPDGGTADGREGIFTFVVERQGDDGWLAVSAQNTDRVPGAETMVAEGDGLTPRDYLGKRSAPSVEG